MARSEKRNFLYAHYDKIIVVVVLFALLLSLSVLISLSSSQRKNEEKFQDQLNALRPEFPEAKESDPTLFNAVMGRLNSPYRIPTNGNSLLVAAERVYCINPACQLPITLDTDVCPYCNAEQPPEDGTGGTGWDSDGDGLPDEWERQHGLNPVDPKDAQADLDGDRFTNLEEYLAKTDPKSAKSHPALVDFLRVDKIDAIPFPYVLRGQSKMGDSLRFQINMVNGGQTFFLKIGDQLADSGYKAIASTNRTVMEEIKGLPPRKRELAVLILSNGTEKLELVQNAPSLWNSFNVTFTCTKLDLDEPIVVKRGESFSFDGDSYTVVKINKTPNSNTGTVVIKQKSTQKEITVPGQ